MTHSVPTRRSSDLSVGRRFETELVSSLDTRRMGRPVDARHSAIGSIAVPAVAATEKHRADAASIVHGETTMQYGLISLFPVQIARVDRKSTRLLQSLMRTSYAVFCLKKKTK